MGRPMVGAPRSLTRRHQHMAYLVAAGKSNIEIAKALGYSEAGVSRIKSSEVFQALLHSVEAEIGRRAVDGIVEQLMAESPKALERMKELRDQSTSLPVAYNASAFFLDKHPAVAAIKATADLGVRILLDDAAMARMERAIAEAERRPALDVTPEPA